MRAARRRPDQKPVGACDHQARLDLKKKADRKIRVLQGIALVTKPYMLLQAVAEPNKPRAKKDEINY